MWSRRELKEISKKRVSLNYWKAVLAAFVLVALCGGGSGPIGAFLMGINDNNESEYNYKQEVIEDKNVYETEDIIIKDGITVFFFIVIVLITIVFLVFFLVILPLNILVMKPLQVGIRRFFTKNLKEQAQIKELCYGFDHGYKNIVKIQFFRSFYIFLWTLLLIVPGIIKRYEYQMVPYILGEHPEMEIKEVFTFSSSMMYGNKWNAFVLDLSFFGWYILNGITLGIVGIFYLNPYIQQTEAVLYKRLKDAFVEKGDSYELYNFSSR